MRMRFYVAALALALGVVVQGAVLFETDFSEAEVGAVPDGLMVMDGQFAVREEGGNRFLELPGAPLDTFGVIFGPSQKEGLAVSARIFATSKGRLFPAFAVSVGGVSGYKLQVSPAKRSVELFKGDEAIASAPYAWTSGIWTRLRLQLRGAVAGGWVVEGRVWADGEKEPESWTIRATVDKEPVAGKAGVWGKPFSGTPVRFDEIKVEPAPAG